MGLTYNIITWLMVTGVRRDTRAKALSPAAGTQLFDLNNFLTWNFLVRGCSVCACYCCCCTSCLFVLKKLKWSFPAFGFWDAFVDPGCTWIYGLPGADVSYFALDAFYCYRVIATG